MASLSLFLFDFKNVIFFQNKLPAGVRSHFGTVLGGVPLYCGGGTLGEKSNKCFKFDKTSKNWTEVKKTIEN
jgi:hypothetical protein